MTTHHSDDIAIRFRVERAAQWTYVPCALCAQDGIYEAGALAVYADDAPICPICTEKHAEAIASHRVPDDAATAVQEATTVETETVGDHCTIIHVPAARWMQKVGRHQ